MAGAGFGIGWYAADGAPAVYRNPAPIWSDGNLPHLGRSLRANTWLATVDNLTRAFAAGSMGQQPFCDERLVFLHSGALEDFASVRRTLREFLAPRIEAEIRGCTDSEHLFALLRHLLDSEAELGVEDGLWELLDLLGNWLQGRRGVFNVVVSDGQCLYAVRHATNCGCAPLYYSVDDDSFPEGQILASQPLTEAEFWQPIPSDNMLILRPDAPPELISS
jgi:glutamine amidotransferase